MSLICPNFVVKLITFPNFGQGHFPKIAGKSPDVCVCYDGSGVVVFFKSSDLCSLYL